MALNEGAIMTEEEINAFVNPFKPDIRQSTLQLQYVISSGDIDHVIFILSIDIVFFFLIIIYWILFLFRKHQEIPVT